MQVRLIAKTEGVGEVAGLSLGELIAYAARVSNPANQHNQETAPRLLGYCIRNGHWSVFETVSMTVEVVTSRAIAAQILRHRSFTFQEFSQRYAEAMAVETYPARRQDDKNRQNSIDDMDKENCIWFEQVQRATWGACYGVYQDALERGIAKEQARFLLPLGTQTRLYMTGSVRSWIHYCDSRCTAATQKEHRDIALACRDILLEQVEALAPHFGVTP